MREDEKIAGTHCQYAGCERTARTTLFRVNPIGQVGVFMCKPHAEEVRLLSVY